MKNNLKQFFIVGVTILLFAVYFGFNNSANSAPSASNNVSGYGWSNSDTGGMGWLSFNCNSGGDCGAIKYGVNIDNSGNMTGNAWSSNYGWIKFGELSGFPSGPGTTSQNAKLNGTTLSGWARACAVFHSGCAGDYYHGSGAVDNNLATNPYLGGWDGWISLRGTDYGVNADKKTGLFSGYGWGGGDVLGWVDFRQVIIVPDNNKPLLYLKVNNQTTEAKIYVGGQVTLSATGQGLSATGTPYGEWSTTGNKDCPTTLIPPGITYQTFTHNTEGTFRYTLQCDNIDNTGAETSHVDVVVLPPDPCEINPDDPACVPPPNPTKGPPTYIER